MSNLIMFEIDALDVSWKKIYDMDSLCKNASKSRWIS